MLSEAKFKSTETNIEDLAEHLENITQRIEQLKELANIELNECPQSASLNPSKSIIEEEKNGDENEGENMLHLPPIKRNKPYLAQGFEFK